jgi:hypothetical protein
MRPQAEFHWWVNLLADQTPTVVDKAAASEGNTPQAKRRAAAFGAAFRAHMAKLRDAPGAYGQTGLFELLELREECLREFGFRDVYRCVACGAVVCVSVRCVVRWEGAAARSGWAAAAAAPRALWALAVQQPRRACLPSCAGELLA